MSTVLGTVRLKIINIKFGEKLIRKHQTLIVISHISYACCQFKDLFETVVFAICPKDLKNNWPALSQKLFNESLYD